MIDLENFKEKFLSVSKNKSVLEIGSSDGGYSGSHTSQVMGHSMEAGPMPS